MPSLPPTSLYEIYVERGSSPGLRPYPSRVLTFAYAERATAIGIAGALQWQEDDAGNRDSTRFHVIDVRTTAAIHTTVPRLQPAHQF